MNRSSRSYRFVASSPAHSKASLSTPLDITLTEELLLEMLVTEPINQIGNGFVNVSPRSLSSYTTRIPSALETAFRTLAERSPEAKDGEDGTSQVKIWNRTRMVVIVWAKAPDEDGYRCVFQRLSQY